MTVPKPGAHFIRVSHVGGMDPRLWNILCWLPWHILMELSQKQVIWDSDPCSPGMLAFALEHFTRCYHCWLQIIILKCTSTYCFFFKCLLWSSATPASAPCILWIFCLLDGNQETVLWVNDLCPPGWNGVLDGVCTVTEFYHSTQQ